MIRRGLCCLVLVLGPLGCVTPAATSRGQGRAGALAVSAGQSSQQGVLGPLAGPDVLEIRILDVGQGDGILLRSPTGTTVLIDAGTGRGGLAVAKALKHLGVRTLDYVVVSHAHQDHIGGFLRLFDEVEIKQVLDPGFQHSTRIYERFLDNVKRRGIPYRRALRGESIDLGKGVRLQLLAPEEPFIRGTRSDSNSNSVVARVDMGSICAVLTGDAELETEERLIASKQRLRCPLLKVAHHGSRYSSSEAWLNEVRPVVAVISAGHKNRYGHPARETLRRLEQVGARIYRTDLHGTVTIRTDGTHVTVTTQSETEDRQAGAEAVAR